MQHARISRGRDLCCSSISGVLSFFMDQLLSSFILILLAEMGDKTQLLSIILAARYKKFWPIFFGISAATVLNHALAAYAGFWLQGVIGAGIMQTATAVIFILLGIWMLVPDKAPQTKEAAPKYGVFLTSLIIFFLAEMGDKTQVATIMLGAKYDASIFIIAGTTLGMMAANAPAILCGEMLMRKLPLKTLRVISSLLFIGFGVMQLCCQ